MWSKRADLCFETTKIKTEPRMETSNSLTRCAEKGKGLRIVN